MEAVLAINIIQDDPVRRMDVNKKCMQHLSMCETDHDETHFTIQGT
jgi:hypothetical protein